VGGSFSYLSRDRAKLLLDELERIQAELKTVGSNAQEATAATVEVLKTIENTLREVCLANGLADDEGGVVVQKVKKGVSRAMKLHGMGAYLIECEALKAHLPKPILTRLHAAKTFRNQFANGSGLLCEASKGKEFCVLGFEVLKAVSLPIMALESKILQKCTVYPFEVITLGRVLGRGGFGEVREATLQGQAVAAKILHPSTFQDDPEARNKLLQELRPLSELQHVNIVRLFGVCLDPHLDCILMEHMHRGSLRQVLNENRLPTSQVFAILRQVVAGMVCAHAHTPHPILHRDLKAANILLDQYLRAAIADFGISTGAGTTTKTTTMAGTVAYDAPEVMDEENWTTAGDVYSFAVLAFEAATGEVPWKGSNLKQIYRAVVLKEQRPHGKQWDEPMDEEQQRHPFLAAIVKDCWAQELGDRPSFADLSPRFDEAATLLEFQPDEPPPMSPAAAATAPASTAAPLLSVPMVESVEEKARKEAEEARENAEVEAQKAQQEMVAMQQVEEMELQRQKEAKEANENARRDAEEQVSKEAVERSRREAEQQKGFAEAECLQNPLVGQTVEDVPGAVGQVR
jgi:serine/threonine protein kinase